MTTQRNSDEIRTRILTENTAQSVLNHLKALESNRAHMRTRWIWELLQNARDTSVDTDTDLVASIEHKPGELVFQHNGPRFKIDEIAHLIYHGSTKVEDAGTIGQYGSGFLTTHLLSPEINISGQLDDGQSFVFRLKREIGSVQELSESMDRAWEEFNTSSTATALGDFTTQFRYPIEDDAVDAVNDGLAMLKLCAPFVVVFNEKFSRIDIKTPNETTSFEVTQRSRLSQGGAQIIMVSENENGNQNNKVYLMAENEKTAVAIPLESMGDGQVCLPINYIPKLFLGFPIVGTENFSFPAVINSFEFTPTEERDGVYIGQADDSANHKNQAVIKGACELLGELLRLAASFGWRNIHLLTEVPAIQKRNWLNTDWLRECLKEYFLKKIRQIPAVINETGVARTPKEAMLPLAETDEGVKALWDLLDGWQGGSEVLPRRNEVVGWCNAVKSWAMVSESEVSSFDEVVDARKLASRVDEISHDPSANPTTHRLSFLDLKEGISAINWLNQLIAFLKINGLSELLRIYRVVPSQEGFLRTLSNLQRDQGIAEDLKDIAKLLRWPVRRQLRDTGISSLADEAGLGDWDSEFVVGELIKRLQERAEENPDDNFAKASKSLFKWIVVQKDWDRLRGFPVFAEEGGADNPKVIKLERVEEDHERPLAPVQAWSKDLQSFFELFPPRHTLSKVFFKAVPDPDVWQTLDEEGFLRKDVIITKQERFNKFPPDEPLTDTDHETAEYVTVTDIAFLTKREIGIMERVRQSQRLARKFWSFLTEWLIVHDIEGLEIKTARCICGDSHRYYPAEWLVPLVANKWVPVGGDKRVQAKADSLASLLRNSEWSPGSLSENPAAIKLLEAIGVTRFDLLRSLIATNEEERNTQDSILTDILVATKGDLNSIHELVQNMKDDEKFLDHFEEHRERKRRVRENQDLGKQIERLVQESLEAMGFVVNRKPIGSDFEIEHDLIENDKEIGIELVQEHQSWLIEVKATRSKEVRMTSTQAKKSVEKGNSFLLCVVPLDPEDTEPELDTVRTKMRFLKNIGFRVAPLCDSLDKLEKLQDKITADNGSGIQLKVTRGAGVHVVNSVWETDGFPLENLTEQLK